MKKNIIAFLICFLFTPLFAREIIPLNDAWNFRFEYKYANPKWQSVNLPHTWNANDKVESYPYERTLGLYKKEITPNKEWENKRVFIRFLGANSIADIFAGDKWLGQHRGGYTAFCYEITDIVQNALQKNKKIPLCARVTNVETSDVLPLTGDFNMFGGLYRGVQLIVLDELCISPLFHGSDGVIVRQKSLSDDEATLEVSVLLENPTRVKQKVSVEISGEEFSAEGVDKAVVNVVVKNPHRWNGVIDPYLYSLKVSVGNDSLTQEIGLREISIDSNKGLLLNGKPYKLRGVCRHQERAGKGNALTLSDHEEDINLIREMGANAIRLAHYPQAREVYELCDRAGLLVWAEIPFVGPGGYQAEGYVPSENLHTNARTQLLEMIYQLGNHASIFTWGLFNELSMNFNPVPFLTELNKLAKDSDLTRVTTAASNLNRDAPLHFLSDLIAWNRYDGWYGGMPDRLGAFLDDVHQKHPNLKIAVSEYGAGACVKHHEENIRKPNPGGRFHPEAWQTEYHIQNWEVLSKREFIWGTFIWNMFDFAAAHRTEGERNGINDKGLITHDRATKKDAFYFYKANWRDDESVVHICEKRFVNRKNEKIFVRAFSNQGEVELFVNGVSQGKVMPNELKIAQWNEVSLQKGENEIVLRSQNCEDRCVWKF